jgi:hypothetical protein
LRRKKMRQLKFLGLIIPAFCLFVLPVQADNELKLGSGIKKFGEVVNIPLTLTTTDQVQGLVATFDWNGANGTGVGLVEGPELADADVVAIRVEDSYMVLGVVMDNDGADGEIIDAGTDILIATAQIECAAVEAVTSVDFRDDTYATVDGGPLLDNIVVVGGLSVGAVEGLVMTSGSFECVESIPRFYIAPGASNETGGKARVLMENKDPVEGYVIALCHNPAELTLQSIDVGAAAVAQAADFSADEIFPGIAGGTLGVVIDLEAPWTNNTIPPGVANEIAVFNYKCVDVPATGQDVFNLHFCDFTLGDPLKENVYVVGGMSLNPLLEDGTVTCKPTAVPAEDCNNGIDDDGDGFVDAADSDCQQAYACGPRTQASDAQGTPMLPGNPPPEDPYNLRASQGGTVEVCFFIKTPENKVYGSPDQVDNEDDGDDHVQGFSMAVSYCCDLQARESLDITGTILEAVGAEYVNIQVDNNDVGEGAPPDDDGCELIIGVLVDALPPFDGQTIPPSERFQRIGCVTFDVDPNAACDSECCFAFTDGLDGGGKVPIENLISVENVSRRVQFFNCCVHIVGEEVFCRGDCNFSKGGSYAVDVSDAAAVVSYLFSPPMFKFQPPCLDACDCNDDSRIDLADAVCILQFLFQQGEFPNTPGPCLRELPDGSVEITPPGKDETEDLLDCAAGTSCI